METEYEMAQIFMASYPHDAARLLEGLPLDMVVEFLNEVPSEKAAEMIHLMDLSAATRCLEALKLEQAGKVVDHLTLHTGAVLCRRLETGRKESVMNLLPEKKQDALGLLLSFPEGTAGALMDPRVLTLHTDMLVEDALKLVRNYSEQVLYYIYVLNTENKLMGVLNLRELMLAPPNQQVASVMHSNVDTLSVRADHRSILAHPAWQRVHALPVVDGDGVFVGVLRYETLRRLEKDIESDRDTGSVEVAAAIGELYRVGLSGLLQGAAPLKKDLSP